MFSSDDSNLHCQVKVGMVLPWSLKVGKISRGFVDVSSVDVFGHVPHGFLSEFYMKMA